MATVVKDFKIKSGLIVEGTTAKVNNFDILTKKQADQDYIIGLIGGTATSTNTANAVVKRDGSGNFAAGTITADLTGDVTGNVTGDVTGDLTGNVTGNVTGDVTGDLTGDVTGNVEGNVTGNLTGNVTGDVSGNAGTATALETARTIAGQTFDGTQNVVIAPTDLDGVTATAAELNILDGATLSTSELNILDGATVTASELNILDGATVSTAELNHVSGVTSAIQDQLDDLETAISDIEADTGLADHNTATSGVHGVTGDVVGTTDTQTLSNKTLGSDLAAGGYKVSGLGAPTSDNDAATKKYVDDEVAALVNGAPELLDTLNEIAEAIGDDANFSVTVANLVAEKQDTLTAGANIDITNDVISVTGLDAADISDFNTAALSATSAAYDAAGSAEDVQDNLDDHTGASSAHGVSGSIVGTSDSQTLTNKTIDTASNDITVVVADVSDLTASASELNVLDGITASTVELNYVDGVTSAIQTQLDAKATPSDITTAIDALTTTDIEEGTSLYFTDARAKTAAAELLTGASKTNITITGNGSGLTITAENGVADSTTNDLVEGTGPNANLYFTDERAVDALQGTDSMFSTVSIDEIALQVAATLLAPTAGVQTAYAWAHADYRSAEFLVKVAYGTHTEISKVLLTLDDSENIAITEYGIVGTNGSASTISAGISGTDVQLLVTTANNTSTVTVVGTLLA
jgi:hypothetical protein